MRSFDAFQVDPLTHAKVRTGASMVSGSEKLIHFKPPRSNSGLDTQKELFRTIFQYEDTETFFEYVNKSAVCGYEVWIEDREIEFCFYVPNEDLEKHYKRQLNTHYSGCELGPKQGKMINIDEDDYAIPLRFQLDNHYFEPVSTRASPSFNRNPYRSILGEMSLNEGMSAMIQFMFKPAEPDWTQLHSRNVTEHADEVIERHSHETKFFGLKTIDVDPPSEVRSEAGIIRDQRGSNGFYMDIRIVLVGPNKHELEEQAAQVSNLYEELYASPTGQQLKPDGYKNQERMKEILIDIAQRNPKYMRQPKAPRSYLHHRFSDNEDTLIMSLDELVSLAPIPYEKDFDDIEGMTWADKPLEGAVSGIGDTWSPPSTEEESEIRERLRGSENEMMDSSVKTPEGEPVRDITPDEDRDEEQSEESVSQQPNSDTNEDTHSGDSGDASEKQTEEKDEDENDGRWNEDIDEMLG